MLDLSRMNTVSLALLQHPLLSPLEAAALGQRWMLRFSRTDWQFPQVWLHARLSSSCTSL